MSQAPTVAVTAPPASAARAGAGALLDIRIEALRKTYGSFVALDDVSLDVRPGEFLTLLGPSGSGKTTLLNCLSGFVRPDAGALWFGADDVTDRPVHARGLGIVFQSYALFPHKSVFENVAFPLRVRKVGEADIRQRVQQALELVRLPALGQRRISELSGGQRQRVALARAVVFSPRIVLMDEPLSALDKHLREQMQVEIRHLHEQIGATTIYVTHDQREALAMSDRVAVMNQGRIEQCDTPARIYGQPASRFVAGFIGETTLVPAVAAGPDRVRAADGSEWRTAMPLPSTPTLHVALRAERLLMPGEFDGRHNRIAVRLKDVIYQGDSLLLLAELRSGQAIAVRKPLREDEAAHGLAPGQSIELGLSPAATIVVPD
ncbi:MAG: ABC transporter ATP-binding protein [Xenophilus sp.]